MNNNVPLTGNRRNNSASAAGPASSPSATRASTAISAATSPSTRTNAAIATAAASIRAAPAPSNSHNSSSKAIDRSWQGHAAAFVRRRVAAVGWLMRTGSVSQRVLVTRDVATRTLEQVTFVYILKFCMAVHQCIRGESFLQFFKANKFPVVLTHIPSLTHAYRPQCERAA